MDPDIDGPTTIVKALSYGAAGDYDHGLALLQPLVDAGPISTFAMLGCLAEAVYRMSADPSLLDEPEHSAGFAMVVDGPDGPATAELLPAPLRFAGRFITCWANRDRDTAFALFQAVARQDGPGDLAEAITALFGMAVAVTEMFVAERHRLRAEQDSTSRPPGCGCETWWTTLGDHHAPLCPAHTPGTY